MSGKIFEVSGVFSLKIKARSARQAKEDAATIMAYQGTMAKVDLESHITNVKPFKPDKVAGRW